MRKIALGLFVSLLAASAAVYNTRAAWTDNVSVLNNRITTGTVDLQVSTDSGTTWGSSMGTAMVLSNLVPGGSPIEGYSFSLKNASTGITDMTLKGKINGPDAGLATITRGGLPVAVATRNRLLFQIYRMDTSVVQTDWFGLGEWESGYRSFADNLATLSERNYAIRAKLDTATENDWQGVTVTFDLDLVGSQP